MANSLNTITVDGVTYDAEQYAKDHATSKRGDELGKDAFLQLLVAQMKYQDPLDPQDNSEYIAELANFSSLEQMTNVASNLESLSTIVNNIDTSVLVGQLSSMIGKAINWDEEITIPTADGKSTTRHETLAGMVQGITMADGIPRVIANVNGDVYTIEISDITKVFEVYEQKDETSINEENSSSTYTTATSTTASSAPTLASSRSNPEPTVMGTFTNPYSRIDTSVQTSAVNNNSIPKSNPSVMGPFTYI